MIKIDNILDVEKYLDGIEVVIFDLDDTLYSEKDYVKSGYRAISDVFHEIPTMYDELLNAFKNKEPAIDVVFERYNMMERKDEAINIYRFHFPNISLYPEVDKMLNRLLLTKKLGIITDGRPIGQRNKIKALGLDSIIENIIITDELGGVQFRKPCMKAFGVMQNRFKVPYQQIVYIGDNINKDFQACKQLGMRCIYFKNKDGLY